MFYFNLLVILLVHFHVYASLVTSFKKSTFKGPIRKKGHIDRKLWGRGQAPRLPPLLRRACLNVLNFRKFDIVIQFQMSGINSFLFFFEKYKAFRWQYYFKKRVSRGLAKDLFKHLRQRALQAINYCCKALHFMFMRGSCLRLWKSSRSQMVFKIGVPEILTPTQVFFCEYCEIPKNSFFHRTLLVAASASGISV